MTKKLMAEQVGARMIWTAAASLAVLFLVCSLPGCGGGGAEGGSKAKITNVSGKVEFDGKPVAAGTVRFTNIDTGNYVDCPISDGTYASESGTGANPGQNTVNVTARETAEGTQLWAKPYTETVQVTEGDFKQDFTIDAKKVKPFDPKTAVRKGADEGDTYDVGK